MQNPKENISFYRGNKAYANVGISKHIHEYDVESDVSAPDGTRTIVMIPTDKSDHLRLCKELADKMVEKLGEGENKLLRKMLLDTLRDYEDASVEDMHRQVVLGEKPVKYKEGCFKIIIGDGRRRNSHEIMLVE